MAYICPKNIRYIHVLLLCFVLNDNFHMVTALLKCYISSTSHIISIWLNQLNVPSNYLYSLSYTHSDTQKQLTWNWNSDGKRPFAHWTLKSDSLSMDVSSFWILFENKRKKKKKRNANPLCNRDCKLFRQHKHISHGKN